MKLECNLEMEHGVYFVTVEEEPILSVPFMTSFLKDLVYILVHTWNHSLASFCYNRAQFLVNKF